MRRRLATSRTSSTARRTAVWHLGRCSVLFARILQMATLQIAERHVGDVTVLDLWGQITLGDASETLRATIKNLIDAGRTRVVLHLGGVRQVDSSGLGSLVAVYTGLQKRGGDL